MLGRRERIDPCETLVLRARADLDGDRLREAALQLRVGLEALLIELQGALVDPGHEEDMATLIGASQSQAGEAANMALRGDLDVIGATSANLSRSVSGSSAAGASCGVERDTPVRTSAGLIRPAL